MTNYSIAIKKEYSPIYPEFDIKTIYHYNSLIHDKISKVFVIEFNRFYPQHIFTNIYINEN